MAKWTVERDRGTVTVEADKHQCTENDGCMIITDQHMEKLELCWRRRAQSLREEGNRRHVREGGWAGMPEINAANAMGFMCDELAAFLGELRDGELK